MTVNELIDQLLEVANLGLGNAEVVVPSDSYHGGWANPDKVRVLTEKDNIEGHLPYQGDVAIGW